MHHRIVGYVLVGVLALGVLSPSVGLAAEVTFDADTTLSLPSGISLTVLNGSTVDGLVVNDDSSLTLTIAADSSITIRSYNIYLLVSDTGGTTSCRPGEYNQISFTGLDAGTITVTASTALACNAIENSGGGGSALPTTPSSSGSTPSTPSTPPVTPTPTVPTPTDTTPSSEVVTNQNGSIGAGRLVKSPSSPSVFYLGPDNKLHPFANLHDYYSWFDDFSQVEVLTVAQMGEYQYGSTVMVRPGLRLIQVVDGETPWNIVSPNVYAVDGSGVLRHITSASLAQELFGSNWEQKIIPMVINVFTQYTIGNPINSAADFNPSTWEQLSIGVDTNQRM